MARKRAKAPSERSSQLAPRSGSDLVRSSAGDAADFDHVVGLIEAARTRGLAAVNKTVVELYWSIGEYIGRKVAAEGWGQGTVDSLAAHVRRRQPNARGFSARNLWRMMQFHQAYRDLPKLSALLTELSWTHNMLILGRCREVEEREFYLRMCLRERWSSRELERQLAGALFERVALSPVAASPVVAEVHPDAAGLFKDSYLLDFLELPAGHSESDLEAGLVEQMKKFLLELGRDFCFVGSQYPLQVGGRDFAIDLLASSQI